MKQSFPILHKCMFVVFACLAIGFTSCDDDDMDPLAAELAQLESITRYFDTAPEALAQGFDSTGTVYVTGMGHHWPNVSRIDGVFNSNEPEFVLYKQNAAGVWEFVAVEYAVVPDPTDPTRAPEGFFGDQDAWAFNTAQGVWTLHCWIELDNSDGIFAPMNPLIP